MSTRQVGYLPGAGLEGCEGNRSHWHNTSEENQGTVNGLAMINSIRGIGTHRWRRFDAVICRITGHTVAIRCHELNVALRGIHRAITPVNARFSVRGLWLGRRLNRGGSFGSIHSGGRRLLLMGSSSLTSLLPTKIPGILSSGRGTASPVTSSTERYPAKSALRRVGRGGPANGVGSHRFQKDNGRPFRPLQREAMDLTS